LSFARHLGLELVDHLGERAVLDRLAVEVDLFLREREVVVGAAIVEREIRIRGVDQRVAPVVPMTARLECTTTEKAETRSLPGPFDKLPRILDARVRSSMRGRMSPRWPRAPVPM